MNNINMMKDLWKRNNVFILRAFYYLTVEEKKLRPKETKKFAHGHLSSEAGLGTRILPF